jgi:hypothetical protein
MTHNRDPETSTFVFNESEWEWIERRADEISLATGDPLPFAKTAAIADLVQLRRRPRADVIELEARRTHRSRPHSVPKKQRS